MTMTTIPVTVTPEAASRVAELGMQAELERMLEHTRATVPGLRSIVVELALPYDTGDEISLNIWAYRDDYHLAYDPTDLDWAAWARATFTYEVSRYFALMSVYGAAHAG